MGLLVPAGRAAFPKLFEGNWHVMLGKVPARELHRTPFKVILMSDSAKVTEPGFVMVRDKVVPERDDAVTTGVFV